MYFKKCEDKEHIMWGSVFKVVLQAVSHIKSIKILQAQIYHD